MKKIYLFVKGAKRWNSLLNKFSKLHKRLQLLLHSDNSRQYNKLLNKLQSIYTKLEKMQYQTGIKVATTSLAIILSAFAANAQFATGKALQQNGAATDVESFSQAVPTFEDIDGDGDLDLYVGDYYGAIKVFTNDGSGVFTASADLQADGINIDVGFGTAPAFADIDGDGDLDLYVGEYYGAIKVFTNNAGVFTAAADLQAGGTDIDVGSRAAPVFADIDGDSDLDLYVGDYYGTIKVFTNNAGVFTTGTDLQADGVNIDVGNNSNPTFADVDADGDLDLYVGQNNARVQVFKNDGSGVFTDDGNLQAGGSIIDLGFGTAPAFADIDGDGNLDLYLGEYYAGIRVYNNNGTTFDAATNFQTNDLDIGLWATPAFADIDGDGDSDLYVGEMNNTIKVFTNSSGDFTATTDLQAGGSAVNILDRSAPTFADIDGDGDLDLYAGNKFGNVQVFTNNAGAFTATADLQQAGFTIDVGNNAQPTFADVDGDGDLDLYIGNNDGRIKHYVNNAGVFTQALTDLQAGGANIDIGFRASPAFADIDGDGDLDLYVGDATGQIKVFTNSGGVFTAAADLQAGNGDINVGIYSTPTFADVDGDGDLDLYVGDASGKVMFYENQIGTVILVSSISAQGVGAVSTITTQGGTLQMEAAVLPLNADDGTYTWSVVNGSGSATIDANGLLTATGDGTVEVTATANDGSGEFSTVTITISNQSVAAVLVSSITVQGTGNVSTITTQGGTLQMQATVLPANADDGTYTWSVLNGTGSASIDANGLLTATADGTVEVTATANDASGETATKTITISNQSVGIKDLAFEGLSIYPNPTSGIVNLQVLEKLTSIRLLDISGRTIQVFHPENRQFDISSFNSGVYFLEITNEERKSVVKIIKK